MKTKLKTIDEELADCRLALRNSKVGDLVWCCHHEIRLEELLEPAENRIKYILTQKPEAERAARFRCFRPWVGPIPVELSKAYDKYIKAHDELNKAYAKYTKAYAKYIMAYDERAKAYDKFDKAHNERAKAYAKYIKAHAKFNEARAKFNEAKAEFDETHDQQWPDHHWKNGKVLGT